MGNWWIIGRVRDPEHPDEWRVIGERYAGEVICECGDEVELTQDVEGWYPETGEVESWGPPSGVCERCNVLFVDGFYRLEVYRLDMPQEAKESAG